LVLVLATKNAHKVEEIKKILNLTGVDYFTLNDFLPIPINESGRTLAENSLIKASFTYKMTDKPSLADDSGLFVDALDGRPGVKSSRYAPDNDERIEMILSEMTGVRDRTAAFRVVFVYYYAPGRFEVFRGECRGRIALAPKGSHGFGYDPVFIPRGYRKTFAELGPAVKNRISHRAVALRKFKKYITTVGSRQ
jgi:XTP/dITP diphosphohydrolase